MAKEIFDFIVCSIAIVLLSLIFAIVAIIIKIGSKGPVIFKQQRVGKDGQPFMLYKFRTMKIDADPFGKSPEAGDDPRLIKHGKCLREYSLDELKEAISDEEKDSLFMPALGEFEELITKEKEQDFANSSDYIKKAIKREVTSKIAGQRGVYEEIILKPDKTILKAIKLLQDRNEFTRVLESGHDRDQVMVDEE